MKNIIKAAALVFVLIILLRFPEPIIMAAKAGLLTWFDKVVPALFPFFVLTRLMIHYQVPSLMGKFLAPLFNYVFHLNPITFFIILMSLISGNPAGAKMARDYYDQKLINEREFQGLIYFCNFSSPLFIIGTIGVILYQSVAVGYFLLVSHLLGSVVVFICCYRYFKNKNSVKQLTINFPKVPFASVLIEAIESSIHTLMRVGGIILFFYIVFAVLDAIYLVRILEISNVGGIAALVAGLLEFTQGITQVASLDLAFPTQMALTALILSFAGFSVHTQVMMFTKDTGVAYGKYLLFRGLHAGASMLIVWFSWRWIFTDVRGSFLIAEGATSQGSFSLIPICIGIIGFYFLLKFSQLKSA